MKAFTSSGVSIFLLCHVILTCPKGHCSHTDKKDHQDKQYTRQTNVQRGNLNTQWTQELDEEHLLRPRRETQDFIDSTKKTEIENSITSIPKPAVNESHDKETGDLKRDTKDQHDGGHVNHLRNDQAWADDPSPSSLQDAISPPAFGLFATVQELVLTVKELHTQQGRDR